MSRLITCEDGSSILSAATNFKDCGGACPYMKTGKEFGEWVC